MSTWDPAFKAGSIVLSGGNLTATSVGATSQLVRGTTSKSAGKVFIEFTLSTVRNDIAVGICNATESTVPGAGLGGDANGMGFYSVSPQQATYVNGVSLVAEGTTSSANGDVVSMAIDFGTTPPTLWTTDVAMRAAGTPWNNSGTANPATNTGGFSLTGLAAGPYFAAFNDDNGGAVCTVNFGATAFNQAIPSGFARWDPIQSVGTATGTSTATAVGQARVSGTGTANGSSTATAFSTSGGPIVAVGTATGFSTATAFSAGSAIATGTATGTSSAIAFAAPSAAAPGVPSVIVPPMYLPQRKGPGAYHLSTLRQIRNPVRTQTWNATMRAGDDFKLALTVYQDDDGDTAYVVGSRSQLLLWPDDWRGEHSWDYGWGWYTGGSPIPGTRAIQQIAGFTTPIRGGGINFFIPGTSTAGLYLGRYRLAIQVDLADGSYTQVEGILQVRRGWGLPLLGHQVGIYFTLDVSHLDVDILAPAVINGQPVDYDGFPLQLSQFLDGLSVGGLEAVLASLPTTLPATPGVLWIDGGLIALS